MLRLMGAKSEGDFFVQKTFLAIYLTQGLIQTMVLRNQWVSGFVYKKVDLVS